MAAGLPVISTNVPSGPREIIRQEVDGLLIPPEDIGALASARSRLMSDEELRQRLGGRATEVSERFALEKIMNLWDEVVTTATRGRD